MQLPVERRFPALVHKLISGTEANARRLIQALKLACERVPEERISRPGTLTATSVISLALELVESTYSSWARIAINCRFLTRRVLGAAHALLDLQASSELAGATVASVKIRPSLRHFWLMRLQLWIVDILGWFAERFAAKKPLPARLAWRAPEAAGIGGAVLPERSP